MRNFCKKAALIAGIMGSAGAVCAQPINPFYRLFPAEVFTSSIEEDVFDDGVRRYAGITAHGKEMDIGIDRLELGTIPGGNLTLEIGGMTIRPRDTAAPAISMTGISIQLRDWPDIQGADGACAWLEQVHSLDIKAAEMRLPSEPAGVTSLRAQGLGFAAQGRAGGCWLEGLLSLASLDVYRGDGSSVALTQLRGEVAAPGSRQAAQSNAAPSGLEVDIAEIELRNASRGPAYAVSDVAIDAALETSSLEGLLHVLRNSRFFGAEAKPELNIMQLTNAFTLLEGQLALEAPITRIYSAGVVPPEAVTNFSKVGLSTITGETSLEVAADRGAFSAQASAAFIGLVDLEGQIAMDLAPYARQKLLAARAGKRLGAHLIPEAAIKEVKLTYRDQGLESYVRDLTGVPTGRYIQEFGQLLANGQKAGIADVILEASRNVSGFFRLAAERKPMVISITPQMPTSVAKIAYLAMTDLTGLSRQLSIRTTQLEKEQ